MRQKKTKKTLGIPHYLFILWAGFWGILGVWIVGAITR